MTEPIAGDLTDAELIERLRRAASIWFKNGDLLLLEELIKRFHKRGFVKSRGCVIG